MKPWERKSIKLSIDDYAFLTKSGFLSPQLLQILFSSSVNPGFRLLSIDRETSERFRDSFTLRLAERGFDANYKLTAEGQILERLIDSFFHD